MTTHDIPALEAAYRDACVEAVNLVLDAPRYSDGLRFEVTGAALAEGREPHPWARAMELRRALQRAKAASEDEDIQHVVLAAFPTGDYIPLPTILAALKAAGYRVTKEAP